MSIVFAGLVPHPPLLIPEIGRTDRDKVSLTDQGMVKFAGLLYNAEPDILIMISPHGPVFSDAIAIFDQDFLRGDFGQYGASQVCFDEKLDLEFISNIEKESSTIDILVALMGEAECKQYRINCELDHGFMVPLYYIRQMGLKAPLIPITIGMLCYEDLYSFGAMLTKVSQRMGKKIAVIASGDLSHRLTPQAPAGYNPHGREFDNFLIKNLKQYTIENLFEIDSKLIEKAGECGYRPLMMMLGSLDGLKVESEIISYEGPFGVGYCVTAFTPIDEKNISTNGMVGENQLHGKVFNEDDTKIPSRIELLYKKRRERLMGIQEKEHPYVRIAREAINNHINNNNNNNNITLPTELTTEMNQSAGVFVSLKKHGQLRGCIGTMMPTQKNLVEEIIQNAIKAASEDPRFFPVEADELDDLTISVDVLSDPEPIESIMELDPTHYGVIVRAGHKSGLLLPDLEGVDSAEDQVAIAKRKAGVKQEDVELFRFEVKRYY